MSTNEPRNYRQRSAERRGKYGTADDETSMDPCPTMGLARHVLRIS